MNPRAIDPTTCWLRHVVRGAASDESATRLGRVYFVRDDHVHGQDGVNGVEGWQEATCTAVLSDDGSFEVTFPNAVGPDGVLHRRRFRVLTDPVYEPGEEWIEFWSDADNEHPLFVGTPTGATKTTTTITLRGTDLTAVLAGALSSDVDVWDAAGPADVIRFYSQIPTLVLGDDTLNVPVPPPTAGAWILHLDEPIDPWNFELEARFHFSGVRPVGQRQFYVRTNFDAPGWVVLVDLWRGTVDLRHSLVVSGQQTLDVSGALASLTVPGPISVRLVVRHEQAYAFLNGAMVAEGRVMSVPGSPLPPIRTLMVGSDHTITGTFTLKALHLETLAPFAARAESIARRLPGILPATGLRAQYWSVASAQPGLNDTRWLARVWPLGVEDRGAHVERVDAQLDFPTGTTGFPPNMPGAWCARWSGAIYLDLDATDRMLRISGLQNDTVGGRANQHGPLRIYVGRTARHDEAVSRWWWPEIVADTWTVTTPALRDWIGATRSGWYPLVIEFARRQPAAGIVLEDTPLDGAGRPTVWSKVPTSRLSPLGCYGEHVRLEQHRTVLGEVAAAFGYQWRVEPRSLESGEFPGELVADDLIGLQTDLAVTDADVGEDAEVRVDAADVVDALSVDGAGIADPKGAGQLTVRGVDYTRATDHMVLRQAYESLAEISEQPLLATRVDSLLVLRGSPNEQVGARPLAQHDLVDTFPLTGRLARLAWRPGDGIKLNLDQLDVVDLTPRQLTTVTWNPRPDGLGIPTVGFRHRPRSARAALSRLTRAIYAPRRNFQGGIVVVTGSPGAAGAFAVEAPDAFSRVALPADPTAIVRVIAVVRYVTGTDWRLEVHNTDLLADGLVPTAGRYDITRWIQTPAGSLQTHARLINGDPARSGYGLTLELWRRT